MLPLPGSSLSQLFGVDHLSSRSPLHRLGEGQGRGGKRLPRAALLPHCDRCLTGASALDFGHPHVEWKAEHAFWAPKSTKSFLAHLEHYAAARVHSATLRESRPSHGPHGEWHHDFPRLGPKSVWRCCGASARVLCPGCGQRVLFVASTLVTSSVTTKVSKSREGRRESAHQRSSSHVGAFPPRWASSASLSPVMSLDPQ